MNISYQSNAMITIYFIYSTFKFLFALHLDINQIRLSGRKVHLDGSLKNQHTGYPNPQE